MGKRRRRNIIILSAILLSLIGLIIFLFLNFYIKTISENQFTRGVNFELNEGRQIKFNLYNHIHKLKVDSVYSDSIRLIIKSNPIRTELEIGEEKKFDIDEDGFFDIQLRLNKITNKIPEIYLRRIHESTCIERWKCDDWSKCYEEGIQMRICSDSNDCGTIKEKPSTVQDCVYNCIENWKCTDWTECKDGEQTRTCMDLNECGTDEEEPRDHRTCTMPIINCGHVFFPGDNSDYDCFIDASENCEPSTLLSTMTLELFGLINTATTRMKLQGIEDGKCIYYQEVESISVKFSEELIENFSDSGLTPGEIDEKEQSANETAQESVGSGQKCKFDTDSLSEMFSRWKEGTSSGGASCTLNSDETWECTYSGDFEDAECEPFS